MAKSMMTNHRQEIKSQYVNGLCFSKEKGLYTRIIADGDLSHDIVYRPHGYYGYVSDCIDIPECDLHIEISANFRYGSSAYLRAKLTYKGKVVLNFDIDKLYVLNNCSVSFLSVPVYEWDSLFKAIISAYKQASSGHYQTASIAYIEGINDMLDKNEVLVRGSLEQEYPAKWEGDLLITLHAGRKLKDLLEGFDHADQIDVVITNYLLNLCRKFILKITSLSLDLDDIRTSQLSECLIPVHQFMCQNKTGAEYLGMFLGINS